MNQKLPEVFEYDHKREADERARWLAVYGAMVASIWIEWPDPDDAPEEIMRRIVPEAERVADLEAKARAAWEAEQVRKLDTDEAPGSPDG